MYIIVLIKRWILIVAISSVLLISRGSLDISPSAELAKSHIYSLVGWQIENFPDKWLYKAFRLFSGRNEHISENIAALTEYSLLITRLSNQEDSLRESISLNASKSVNDALQEAIQKDIELTQGAILSLRNRVEEFLESQISSAIRSEGIGYSGPAQSHFPPVDFRLTYSPKILVTSARNRIDMIEGILLEDTISSNDMDILESDILEELNLSAYVTDIGGLATYPSVVNHRASIRSLINTATHEWLHHYLFFNPLGQGYWADNNMRTINETTANIFGREISQLIYQHLEHSGLKPIFTETTTVDITIETFDFSYEMQSTRLSVDKLLSQGKIDEAEAYMQDRRLDFLSKGYNIRKLNQAYFAFHGTYSDSPTSVSPIYAQLQSIRSNSNSLEGFIDTIAKISSHEEFLALIQEFD
jgi:hypothetical protein